MVTLTGDFGGEQNFCSHFVKESLPISYSDYDKKWERIWSESCTIIQNSDRVRTGIIIIGIPRLLILHLEHHIPFILSYIYWRLGREAGTIINGVNSFYIVCCCLNLGMHKCPDQISWGTYNDLIGTHCNAHINNFVVLPKVFSSYLGWLYTNAQGSSELGFLLSPLDYDMAFRKSAFLGSECAWEDTLNLGASKKSFRSN
jgi:hypothetical protein